MKCEASHQGSPSIHKCIAQRKTTPIACAATVHVEDMYGLTEDDKTTLAALIDLRVPKMRDEAFEAED